MSEELLKMMFYTSFKMHPWPPIEAATMLYDTYKDKEVNELKNLILSSIPGDENMVGLVRDALVDVPKEESIKIVLKALNTKYSPLIAKIAENAADSKKIKSLIEELILEISK